MYNNEEVFPRNGIKEPYNAYIDVVIKGTDNVIEHSVRNSIINGFGNYVGKEASNISIFNSSGCTVTSGVVGCVLINSSGITVSEDNLVYINSTKISNSALPSGSYVKTSAVVYYLTAANDTVEILLGTAVNSEFNLPNCLGHYRKFTIKNNSVDNQSVLTYGSNTIDGSAFVILTYQDSITVQSDGVSNYIII